MEKVPITFREKVEARYVRKGTGPCWMWEGSLMHGRPAVNLRHVLRFIYEWERGPIPPGHTLWRTDHHSQCRELDECRHLLCVNPYHVRALPRNYGLYPRFREWPGNTTEHTLHYLRQQRARRGPSMKGSKDDDDGDSQGGHALDRVEGVEGLRVAQPDEREPGGAGDSRRVRE